MAGALDYPLLAARREGGELLMHGAPHIEVGFGLLFSDIRGSWWSVAVSMMIGMSPSGLRAASISRDVADMDQVGRILVELAAGALAKRLVARGAPGTEGYLVLNPCSFIRRLALELPDVTSAVPVGGAADQASLAVGNALVGNPPDAAALEISLAGPTLTAACELACVVHGAPFTLTSDRQRLTAGKTFTLEPLRLSSPEAKGALSAEAKVHLDAKPVGGEVKLDWADVVLPADLAGQEIATHGSITAGGNAEKFNAQGELSIGPPKQIADLAFKLDGTPEKISLAQLELKQPKGGLNATGDVVLKP